MSVSATVGVGLGERVKASREAAELSQQAAAVAAGLSVATWSKVERGEVADPSWSTVVGMAKALGASLDDWAG